VPVDRRANNFIQFHPKKPFVWFRIYNLERDEQFESDMDEKGIDYEYKPNRRRYAIKMSSKKAFEKCMAEVKPLVVFSMERAGASPDSE